MIEHTNQLGQPIGFPVEGWTARERPSRTPMTGRFCRVEPLDPSRHAAELYAANGEDRDGRMWTYLPWGPYDGFDDYLAAVKAGLLREDFLTYAVIDAISGKAVGVASYLNINLTAGSIEVGGIAYSLRMEVQCAERAVARRGRALRLPLRGDLPPGPNRQRPQPRHRLVLDHRQRVAGDQSRIRTLARPGEFRWRRPPADAAIGADRSLASTPLPLRVAAARAGGRRSGGRR